MRRADEASEPLEQDMMGQGGGIENSSSGSGGADMAEFRARRERPPRDPKYLCC